MTVRQFKALVAASVHICQGLQAWCGRGQDNRRMLQLPAHDRHIPGVIAHAILLLKGAVVLLVYDDEAKAREWQEECRPCADDDARLPRPDCAPGAAAFNGGQFRMLYNRPGTKTVLKSVKPLVRQCDLGQQAECLATSRQCFRYNFHINDCFA